MTGREHLPRELLLDLLEEGADRLEAAGEDRAAELVRALAAEEDFAALVAAGSVVTGVFAALAAEPGAGPGGDPVLN